MLNIIIEERRYWLSLIESNNRLLARVAKYNLGEINRKFRKFNSLTKTPILNK